MVVLAGDSQLVGAGEGERALLVSCLESCLIEEVEAFLEVLLDFNVFFIQTGEEEVFLCFFFLVFWGGKVDWSCLLLRFGGGTHLVSGSSF